MKPHQFDWSRISTHQGCPRKGMWQYEMHLQPKQQAVALDFGGAMHEGLYVLYPKWDVVAAQMAFIRHYNPPEGEWRDHSKGTEVLDAYAQYYANDGIEVLHNETSFAVPLKGDLLYVGRIDKIIVENTDQVYVMEHKTTTVMGATYYNQFRPNGQIIGYFLAGQILSEHEINGVLLDVLYFLKSGTIDFDRNYFKIQQWEIDEYMDEVMYTIKDIQRCRESGFWPKHTLHCTAKYGTCKYRTLCNSRSDAGLVEANYDVVEWDPMAISSAPKETKEEIE